MDFSAKNRAELIKQIGTTSFDLLVIGGGITGAGIALDASARGLKVALVDMQDFSAGTSSRSTKLIHGGLRYLKQFEFKLVAQVGKERKIIHRLAPHLTKPELMLLPIVKNGSLGKLSARFGMWIYECLAGVKKTERYRALNIEQTISAEPLLKKENLLGGILFYEYRTDDARLTIEVLKEAVSRNAIAINYMKVISFTYKGNKISGAKLEDTLSGELHEINAKHIVNAGGPWVDELDDLDKKEKEHKLQITKGVHLVVDWKKLPVKQSLYFDTFDKRMVFVIPRDGKTYIGTTDTFYNDNKPNPLISKEDRDYLIRCINDYFPESTIKVSDIESGWAGLRPLINKPGKGPSEISRKEEMFESESGLLTIAGGKLTGYRKMAERVVNKVAENIRKQEGKQIPLCSTHLIQLSGGKMEASHDFAEFVNIKIKQGNSFGLPAEEAKTLALRYGSNVGTIYRIIESLKDEKSEVPLLLRAQLRYAIQHEMCMSPCDFFIRRTGLFYFNIEVVKTWKQLLIQYMQAILLWDGSLVERYNEELNKYISEIESLHK